MPSISRFFSRVFNPPPTAGQPPRGFSDWTIAGVRFAQDGLSAGSASEASMTWTAPGCEIELTQSAHDGIVDSIDVERLRNEQRRIAIENGRGLVCAEVLTTRGIPLIEVVTKGREGPGYDYVGTIVGTGANHTYTVRVTAHSPGLTGMREAVVSSVLIPSGDLRLPRGSGPIPGFSGDPYDPAWDDGALNAISDDERLDVLLPDDPLTRLRALLGQIRESIIFDTPPNPAQTITESFVTGLPRRQLLSDAAAREIQWAFECFDPIETALRQTVMALDAGPGDNRDAIAEDLLLLGIVQGRQQKPADALESLSRASNLFNGLFGPDHPKTAVAMGYLACAQLDLEHLDAAAELFSPALKVLETSMPDHPAFGTILLVYGRLLSTRDAAQAKAVYDRALGIIKKHPAPNILLREFAGAPVVDRAPRRTA